MTITLEVDAKERAACDEMKRLLNLPSDEALLRAALYKLAAWLEADVDTQLFRQFRGQRPERQVLQ